MEQGQSAVVRRTGTVVKRSGARVFILEDHQNPEVPEKDLWFISARRFRDSADGWKVKPGDRVSFAPSNMMKRPNPVANDAYIVSSPGDLTVRPIPEPTPQSYGVDEDDDKDEAADFVFWRRCPICPGFVASSLEEWEGHLASEEHIAALRARAKSSSAAPVAPGAGVVTGPPPGLSIVKGGPVLPVGGNAANFAAPSQSRFLFAQQPDESASSGWPAANKQGTAVAAAPGLTLPPSSKLEPLAQPEVKPEQPKHSNVVPGNGGPGQQQAVVDAPPPSSGAATTAAAAPAASAPGNNNNAAPPKPNVGVTAQTLVLPRHSPDEPARITVAYRNGFVMEYEFPDVSIPVAVLRKAPAVDVIRRQWLVQRLEVVMGEMDEQLPRAAFQNSALDWRDSFLTRLEMHTGERWTWKKIDGELCLGEGKSSATFWRALRVGIQSSAHAAHQNVLVVKPANATQKMLFGRCGPAELPRSWEIPAHGKFIRLSFVRPELVYAHHERLNNSIGQDDLGREVQITTEVDVPSLMPMWRLDWRSLMAMPEPIFPGAIHVVGSTQEAPRAIEKLVASVAPDGLIGLWGEWSGDTKGHEYNRLQVIQLATEKCSVVFKVGTWKMLPPAALELFTHPRLRTVALGGQEITKKLRKDFKVDVTNGIDVLDLPAAQRCQPRSLKGLVGVFLQYNVGMDQAGSQWDAPRLTPGQLTHAATRPWLVLILYRKILTIDYNPMTGVVEGTLTPKAGVQM